MMTSAMSGNLDDKGGRAVTAARALALIRGAVPGPRAAAGQRSGGRYSPATSSAQLGTFRSDRSSNSSSSSSAAAGSPPSETTSSSSGSANAGASPSSGASAVSGRD